jgi:hypothetical protein
VWRRLKKPDLSRLWQLDRVYEVRVFRARNPDNPSRTAASFVEEQKEQTMAKSTNPNTIRIVLHDATFEAYRGTERVRTAEPLERLGDFVACFTDEITFVPTRNPK